MIADLQRMADNYDQGSLFASFSDGPRPSGLMQTVSPYNFDYASLLGSSQVEVEAAMNYMSTTYYGKEKAVQKTFCDLCETEIANFRIRLNVGVIHTTKDDQVVGEDEYKPLDICRPCAAKPIVLLELLTKVLRMYNTQPVPMDETPPLAHAAHIEFLGEPDGPGDGRAIEAPRVQIGPDGAVELNTGTD